MAVLRGTRVGDRESGWEGEAPAEPRVQRSGFRGQRSEVVKDSECRQEELLLFYDIGLRVASQPAER